MGPCVRFSDIVHECSLPAVILWHMPKLDVVLGLNFCTAAHHSLFLLAAALVLTEHTSK